VEEVPAGGVALPLEVGVVPHNGVGAPGQLSPEDVPGAVGALLRGAAVVQDDVTKDLQKERKQRFCQLGEWSPVVLGVSVDWAMPVNTRGFANGRFGKHGL
jgi:hypothetical protein